MTMIQKNLQQLQAEFSEFEDGFERYAYLVELAALLPPYPEDQRTPAHLVQGCQSQVWLAPYTRDGKFYFDADSDTLIIKGVLLILRDLLHGIPLQDAVVITSDVLTLLGIAGSFSDTRQKGIAAAITMLKEAAQKYASH